MRVTIPHARIGADIQHQGLDG